MFWKHVKKLFTTKYSIATQLAIYYSFSCFLLIVIVFGGFYGVLISILNKANHQYLEDEINIIHYILETNPHDRKALQQEILDPPNSSLNSINHSWIRITDNRDQVIMETPNADATISLFINNKQIYQHVSNHVMRQDWIKVNAINSPWRVQIVLRTAYQNQMVHLYGRYILLSLILLAALSTAMGFLLSRRGLHRLTELTHFTHKITALSLHERINPTDWPPELRQLAIAYNAMLDRIASALSRLTEFSDDLAHELRTPITNLIGQTEVVLSQQHNMNDYKTTLTSNLEEFQRLSQIIEDLLFLARAEDPQLQLQKTFFDVKIEIEKIINFFEALTQEKNVMIDFSCQKVNKIYANTSMFRRLIVNILANALRHAPQNSTINISAHTQVDNELIIILTDQGPGIAPEHLPHLFKRFFRIDFARDTEQGGSGLGLPIAKSIVTLHQGTIDVESQLGRGTCVTIRLPVWSR